MQRTVLALWNKKSKEGNEYLSGIVDLGAAGSTNVVVFPNTKKKGKNHPDYYGKLSQPLIEDVEDEEGKK